MTEERLSRANELSNFVNAYKEVIGRYNVKAKEK